MSAVHPETGAYRHVVERRGVVQVAGQVPLAPDGSLVGRDDVAAQAHQVFANLRAVLAQVGLGLADVTALTTYLVAADDAPVVGAVRGEYLTPPWPASTVVVIKELLRPEWRLEVQAVAIRH